MPTKIIAGTSEPQNSLIKQGDIKTITDAYSTDCTLKSISGKPDFGKTESISIPLKAMQQLIDDAIFQANITNVFNSNLFIKFKFGITLPGQKDCETDSEDISNRLTFVVMISEKKDAGFIDHDFVPADPRYDNFILTGGFKAAFPPNSDPLGGVTADVCCPHQPPGA